MKQANRTIGNSRYTPMSGELSCVIRDDQITENSLYALERGRFASLDDN